MEKLAKMMTFGEASVELGHSRTWLARVARTHPEYFDDIQTVEVGTAKVILLADAVKVDERTKKGDGLVSSTRLKTLKIALSTLASPNTIVQGI